MDDEENIESKDSCSQNDLAPRDYEYLDEDSPKLNIEERTVVRKRRKMVTTPPLPVARHRTYPENFEGPWVVFFRPIEKPLNIMRIQEDLAKHFPAVTEIRKIRPNRLRVEVSDRKQANDIVRFELFTRQYRVYIPARDVEVDGVITEGSLNCDDLLKSGIGSFKNPSIKSVKILDCKQLSSVSRIGDKTSYSRSDSFRVTFEGSALPDFVSIGKVRLPVRLFMHRVMTCLNCKQFGHTATHCSSKTKCGKCGEMHGDASCEKPIEKCFYCGESPHVLSACPMYKKREEKLKRSAKARSQRSYAELLKNASTANSTNRFQILTDSSDEDETCSASQTESLQKQKQTTLPSAVRPRKDRKMFNIKNRDIQGSTGNALAREYDKEFPELPGPSKVPISSSSDANKKKKLNPVSQEPAESGLISFDVLVEWIMDALALPEYLRSFIVPLLPKLKEFLKKLSVKLPILSVIVSLDG